MQSHVVKGYKNESFDLIEAVVCDVFRINVNTLVNKKSPFYLDWINSVDLGDSEEKVEQKLQKMYQTVERHIHTEAKSNFQDKIVNPLLHRIKAGAADFGLAGGHKRKVSRDDNFYDIYQQFEEGIKNAKNESIKMICSEFATRANVAALIKLDHKMTRHVRDEYENYLHGSDPTLKDTAKKMLSCSTRTQLSIN